MLSEEKRIKTKQQLKEYLAAEAYQYDNSGFQKLLNVFNVNEGAVLRRHMILLRKTEYYLNTGKKVRGSLYKLRLRRIQKKYGMHVALNACGKGLQIAHLGPVLMNGQVTIGENCTIHMNAGIVAGGTDDAAPTLGNNVMVGFGAVVTGGIIVADGVAIGANSVVNKDVLEKNISVAGAPAKKISDRGSEAWHTGIKQRDRSEA